MINISAVTRITFPHLHRPTGCTGPSKGCSCVGAGVGFVSADALGGAGVGAEVVFFLAGVLAGARAVTGVVLSFEGVLIGGFVGNGVEFCLEGVLNGENASHDCVSGLTCMPYLRSACLAEVQVKNFWPGFGLKFWQLPQIS